MALDITLKAKGIEDISIIGTSYYQKLSIDLYGADIANCISIEQIIDEYGKEDILDEIGEEYIINWLRDKEYIVTGR
ncbi:hypothetical protein J8Z83_10480 [Yersinia enterocolitica]|uniref:hypothetical protein n=1 Tax=Yersinia enterocolitica TaxID=630 RepID=UPI001C8CFBDF|nr:hypothetical protein [Yersinia enterocolitica]MBX9475111.1 hypothetical protein [Yersinia enterocolitica]